MGYLENSFWPSGTGSEFTLGETMTALQPWKRHLIYLDGLALYGAPYYFNNSDNEHGTGSLMVFTGAKPDRSTGYANGPSVDQAIADFQQAQLPTPLHSLSLGIHAPYASPHSSVFYAKAGTPVPVENDLKQAFDLVFRHTSEASKSKAKRAKHRSVLNDLTGDLSRIHRVSGPQGRQVLDAHLTRLRDLENKLALLHGSGMQPTLRCAAPPVATPLSLEAQVHARMDLIVSAFACDITRSASLQLGVANGGLEPFAGLSHDDAPAQIGENPTSQAAVDNHKKFDRWFADRWAYLLGQLGSVPEGDGTMLDNTLVFFGSDTTTLQQLRSGAHFQERMPLWLAGGGNFAFKTGQVLKLASPSSLAKSPAELATKWVPHHRLLTSICQAFGMNVDRFGDYDPGSGPLPQLTRV